MVASTSQAAPFSGNVQFLLGVLPPITASGAGTGTSCGACGAITIQPAGWGTVSTLVTLAPTAAPPLTAIEGFVSNPACNFGGAGGPGGGVGGACGLGGTVTALVNNGPFLVVPLSAIGVNGRVTFGAFGSYIDAQAWTTGTLPITVNGVTLTTDNGAPAIDMGYDNRGVGGVGTVKLVAPAGLMSTLAVTNFPLFVSMTLTFVPEPGTLLLLGSGVVGLVVMGQRRRKKA
jgi:hypothetical protein